MNPAVRYASFSDFLARHVQGKVQKISVDAGFTCPNRDGTLGTGGCTYCNNRSFSPEYCRETDTVARQLERGRAFFGRKYPGMRYLAYFQSYTNTYADLDRLRRLYGEALGAEGVVGLVIGTRPDCVGEELLDYLAEVARRRFVLLEYGVETTCDATLRRVRRGHTFACSAEAIRRTAARGIHVGAHVILGLPGEGRSDILAQAAQISALPLDTLKMHQLQIVRGTRMAAEYAARPADFHLYGAEEYAELVVDYLERLRPTIAVERFTSQTPAALLVAPAWGVKNHEFADCVRRRLRERDTWQGRLWHGAAEQEKNT